MFQIKTEQLNAILNYLASQKFSDVYQLINMIDTLVKEQTSPSSPAALEENKPSA